MSPAARIISYENRLLWSSPAMWLAWLLLLGAGMLAVFQGHLSIEQQRHSLAGLPDIQAADVAFLERRYPEGTDAGNIGYYLFLPTQHPPSDWADLAVGLRDAVPVAMKVRLLGLYSQIFDAELINPTPAAAGRFDFAFFLGLVLPVWLILLSHGVLGRDQEGGTDTLVRASAASLWRLLVIRIGLRWLWTWIGGLLLLALALLVTPAQAGAEALAWALFMGAYLAVWAALCCLVVALGRSSVWTALALLAGWTVLTLLLPAALGIWTERRYPVADVADLVLEQRQVMHTGWDLPKEATFERFFLSHPEWQDTPPVTERFHWKWYFAMHQVADDAVRQRVAQYNQRLLQRDALAASLAGWLPTAGLQRGLSGLAGTDLVDHLRYLDSVANFHDSLRAFFYPRLFEEQGFAPEDFARLPAHQPPSATPRWPWRELLGMLIWTGLLLLGARRLLAGRTNIRP